MQPRRESTSLSVLNAAFAVRVDAAFAAMEVNVIKAGETAPSWSGQAGGGSTLRSDDYRGKKHVILYFFPKDFTPG